MNKEWKMMQGSYEMLLSDIAVLLAGNQFDTEAVSKSLKLICDSFSFTYGAYMRQIILNILI